MHELLIRNARIYPCLRDAAPAAATTLAISGGKIVALGVADDTPAQESVDAGGRVLLPGLVDCHTHALYAGDRMAEHVQRMRGVSYADIARAGGGIQTTVKAVREASESQLIEQTLPRLEALRAEGVTTVEIKSGYGLDADNELKMLRAIRGLRPHISMHVVATFLGAHAVPKGQDRAAYMREVVDRMLPAVAAEELADTVDIFVEHIAFTVDDLRRLVDKARSFGLRFRAHTDQLSSLGATRIAAELGALSCDHLEHAAEADVAMMAAHGTVAVLLPGAFYFLKETRKPPLELLRQHRVPLAVASDLNPGSSPIASLLTNMHMAGQLFGLTPDEVLMGVTRHAAQALGRADRIGGLASGRDADFGLWDIPAPDFLCYQLGGIRPRHMFFKGKRT